MNEQLQGKLVEILASIQDAARATGDFAMRELPDVAQSYVMYGRGIYTLGLVAGLLLVLVGVFMMRTSHRSSRARIDANCTSSFDSKPGVPSSDQVFMFGFFGVFMSVAGFTAFAANVSPALLVWLAPKVWLLKEIAALIK